jgi:hypothetical protein
MARLLIKSEGFENQVIDLKLGVNRVGRSPKNEFQIEHPTISSTHCELEIIGSELVVHDCDSTNGTFVDGELVKEVRLSAGQTFFMGEVEFYIESTEMVVEVPRIEVAPKTAPPIVLTDGNLICPRHIGVQVTHQCTLCREVMCDACVHRLRRRGGKPLLLCPICSNKVEPLGGKKKKKSILGFLHRTVKLPFLQNTQPED